MYAIRSYYGQFFAVNTPNGVRLTRDGLFTMNGEGKLVTKQGYEVLSADYFQTKTAISFTPQDSVISIDKNGVITSYSIHYTKLYEISLPLGNRVMHMQCTNCCLHRMKELQSISRLSEKFSITGIYEWPQKSGNS